MERADAPAVAHCWQVVAPLFPNSLLATAATSRGRVSSPASPSYYDVAASRVPRQLSSRLPAAAASAPKAA